MPASENAAIERIRAEIDGYGYTDFLRNLPLAREAVASVRPVRIAILRSYTAEPIEPVLELRLLLDGLRPSFWFGGYNQYVQEIVEPQSGLRQFRPDLVLLMIRLEEVMSDFLDDFPSRQPAEWKDRIAAAARELGALVIRLRESLTAEVIVQNMVLARDSHLGIHDAQHRDGQSELVHHFNALLVSEIAERESGLVWDFDALMRREGSTHLLDPKMWYVSKNPYKQVAYPAIAKDLMRYIRSVLGRVAKCVVVDLDNTLWGGVAGEDGIQGIRLGHAYPGNCFQAFQRELLKLYDRGILLAINSKNNPDDAYRIIEQHPDMILRRNHFAAARINWNDKVSNLRELAAELNIGLDSCIMIDDSPVECALLRQECPECEIVLLPEKPYLIPEVVRQLPGIEKARLTDEDRRKGEMYRARAERQALEQRYTDLAGFLQSLDIHVAVEEAVPFSIPRIAQLTQKTNQMNMTTRRYTEAEIQALVEDPRWGVFSVAARDRFGDEGIVGVIILKFEDTTCRIDTLLLSCRVIGRGIEQLMVSVICDVARARGARVLIGEFLPTAKNRPAAGVYEGLGFVRSADTIFETDLEATEVPIPPHLQLVTATVVAAASDA